MSGDHDDLRGFYKDAAEKKVVGYSPPRHRHHPSSPSGTGRPYSYHTSSQQSLAELSRMEDIILSGTQSSYHKEEEERQSQKLQKRARLNDGEGGTTKKKKPSKPPTATQIQRQKSYQRFVYKKKTNYDHESDSGGSMEYLIRRKLSERGEQQRLRKIAHERGERKRRMNDEILDGDGNNDKNDNNDDHDGVNWNFAKEGYVTMPRSEAQKLPYYIYRNSNRKRKYSFGADSDDDDNDDISHKAIAPSIQQDQQQKKKQNTGHLILLDKPESGIRTKRGKYRTKAEKNAKQQQAFYDEPDNVTRSFPLHFHQFNSRMDLHSMIDVKTSGNERLVFSHGRNAKRLWTRLVAGGGMNHDFFKDDNSKMDSNNNNEMAKEGENVAKEREEDDDNISNMFSSSSKSSSSSDEDSYQPPGFSQLSHLTSTSVIDNTPMGNVDDTANKARNKDNALLRLMSIVHELPRTSHRNQFVMKVAQELGTNLRLWENQLKDLVDGGVLSQKECWAIKSFLGIDGSIVSSAPSWMCDPSLPTHPTVLKNRVASLRLLLLGCLRPLLRGGTRKGRAGQDDAEATGKAKASSDNQPQSNEDEADEEEEPTNTTNLKRENDFTDPMHPDYELKGEEGNPDSIGNYSIENTNIKLLSSIINKVQQTADPGADKYATVIHEADIDTSNIVVVMAWFLAQLTSSKMELIQKQQQQLDSGEDVLKVAQKDVGQWHESAMTYLKMAEELSEVRGASFYKSGENYPQSAPLAEAVMSTQSYLANSGGAGWGPKRDNKQSKVKFEDTINIRYPHYNHHHDFEETINEEDLRPAPGNLGEQELHGIHMAAKDLTMRGKDRLLDRHLTSFASIHLTTGIAMIAEVLPPLAAELVSRQCCPESSDHQTPFDLLSNVIVMITADGSLIPPPTTLSSVDTKQKTVIDEVLVNAMHDAAMIFQNCINAEPENVDNWTWYVASTLGMLCIASGLSSTNKSDRNVKMENEGTTTRHQMEGFHDIRCNAAVALTDFLKYCQGNGCPVFQLAVASMLEWKEAILLLHRPISDESEFGLEVRKLHAYHTYQWAGKVCTSDSICKVQQLCESNYLPRDALLDALAKSVEQDPCDRMKWVQLIKALRGVHTKESGDVCLHAIKSEEHEHSWWGKDRAAEWEELYFSQPKSATQLVKTKFVDAVAAVVESALSSLDAAQSDTTVKEMKYNNSNVSIPDPKECMGWIWNPLEDTAEVNRDLSLLDILPSNINVSTSQEEEVIVQSEYQERLSHKPSCEAICMKIIVACHMLGKYHPFVCNSIWWLAVKLWHVQKTRLVIEDSVYYNGLAWLSECGLDISIYIQCRLENSEK